LSPFGFPIFLIPGTFHLKRWSLSSAPCPASEEFPFNSNPPDLCLAKPKSASTKTLYPPALNKFHFKRATEYLEELVTRIDAPQLNILYITFFNQIDFDCPRLTQFIKCTPTLRALDEARVQFNDSTPSVKSQYLTSQFGLDYLEIGISCREPDWQLSSVEQVCNSPLPPFSTVEDLYIERRYSELVWKNDAIAAALQELVAGRITEVLPSLQSIFVQGIEPSGPFQEKIGQFVAARRLSGHPIAISLWNRDSESDGAASRKRSIIFLFTWFSCFRGISYAILLTLAAIDLTSPSLAPFDF
jgi:hypothetical protein